MALTCALTFTGIASGFAVIVTVTCVHSIAVYKISVLLADAAGEDPDDSHPINPAAATAKAIPVILVFICVFTIAILLWVNLN